MKKKKIEKKRVGENSLGGREPKDEEGVSLEKRKKNQKNRGRMRKERKEIGKGRKREGEEKKGF